MRASTVSNCFFFSFLIIQEGVVVIDSFLPSATFCNIFLERSRYVASERLLSQFVPTLFQWSQD